MSQKAFDKVNDEIIDAKAAIDLLIVKRRSLREALVKDLTPKKSFDMRLEQLLLEHPNWHSDELESYEEDEFTIFNIGRIDDAEYMAPLMDPRYRLSSYVDIREVFTAQIEVFDKDDTKEGKKSRFDRNRGTFEFARP